MAIGDLAGRAPRASRRNPSALGICDTCGFTYSLNSLSKQYQWAGSSLMDTGFLVCPRCLDVPQPQFRSIILPPDPEPRVNPRPSYDTTPWAPGVTPGNQGFTQYVLQGGPSSEAPGAPSGIGQFIIGVSAIGGGWDGQSTPGNYPTDQASVLQQVATLSGIPTPAMVTAYTLTILRNLTQPLVPANPARSWLLIYNPAQPVAAISTGTALWGMTTNLMIGPGEAWFWSTLQGFGPVYTGAMTAIGLIPNVPLWAWEA